jgi:hypothetical protein
VLIGIAAALILALIGVGGYFALHKTSSSVITITTHEHNGPTGPTGNSGPTLHNGPTGPTFPQEAAVARRLDSIAEHSKLGRTDAVTYHDYGAAIQNREVTLQRLSLLPRTGISPGLRSSISTLTRAIQWSLKADEAYAAGNSPGQANTRATELKLEFAAVFNPIASQYGLATVVAGAI